MHVRVYDTFYSPVDGICLWAKGRETYCLHVRNSPYKAYISLPLRAHKRIVKWNDPKDIIRKQLLIELKRVESFKFNIVFKYPQQGYVQNLKPYLEVIAPSHKALKDKEKQINGIIVEMSSCIWHETDASPCFKLYMDKGWDMSSVLYFNLDGAIECDSYEEFLSLGVLSTFVTLDRTIHVNIDADSLEQSSEQGGALKIVYFDIETYSASGAFPNASLPSDCIYLISLVFEIYKRPQTRKRVVVALGGTRVPDVQDCIFVRTETELLETAFEVLGREGPDVISGYNIHAFDIPYIETRMARSGVDLPPVLSRLPSEHPSFGVLRGKRGRRLSTLEFCGRIVIDLYTYILADTAFKKLPSYKLSSVLKTYVPDQVQKIDLSYKDQFKFFYEFMRYGRVENYARVIEYCLRDSESLCGLMAKRNVIESCLAMSKVQKTSIQNVVTAGSVQKSYNLMFAAFSKAGVIMEPRQNNGTIEYDGGHVFLQSPGIHEGVAVVDFNSLYPSEMDSHNLCHTTLVPAYMLPTLELDEDDLDSIEVTYEYSEKAVVLEERDVAEESDSDVEELTPSQVQRKIKNIVEFKPTMAPKTETLYFVKSSVRRGVIPTIVAELVGERKNVRKQLHDVKLRLFAKFKTLNLGMADVDLETYISHEPWQDLANRGISAADIEECTELNRQALDLDLTQNAIKVISNSVYGIMGSQADYGNPFIAMATCAYGRRDIKRTAKLFVKKYAESEVVYIDTDSVFLSLPAARYVFIDIYKDSFWKSLKRTSMDDEGLERFKISTDWQTEYKVLAKQYSVQAAKMLGDDLCNTANNGGLYTAPMKLGFEGVGSGFWVIKKMYAIRKINEEGVLEEKLRGIPLRRGDYAKIVKTVYARLVKDLLDGIDYYSCMQNSIALMRPIFKKTIDIADFKITTQFQKVTAYKSSSAPMVKLAIAARKDGVPLEDYSLVENIKVLEDPHLATLEMYSTGKYKLDKLHYYDIVQSRMDKTLGPLLDEVYFWVTPDPYVYKLTRKCTVHDELKFPGCNGRYVCKYCSRVEPMEGLLWNMKTPYESLGKAIRMFGSTTGLKMMQAILEEE